jgi:O-acetylhomoserine (thiol)-lyase
VVHSTTKYLNGHGSAVGGVLIDSGHFSWPEEKFTDFKPFKERKGNLAYLDKVWREIHVNFGTTPAPLHSFLTLLGLDTLAVRMERHLKNALQLAQHLQQHPKVNWVNYPGLSNAPYHDIAQTQFGNKGFGAVLTFGLENQKACFDFVKHVKMVYHLANLGDCKTLIIHPWSSQYVNFSEQIRIANGIKADMIRVAVGIEDIEDIIDDFNNTLKNV